jgi:16S rRNA C1402 (ribose-2'-O) methylase RsmI
MALALLLGFTYLVEPNIFAEALMNKLDIQRRLFSMHEHEEKHRSVNVEKNVYDATGFKVAS